MKRPGISDFDHLGDRLDAEQIQALPDGAEIMVTWDGGNGPWPYRVLVEFTGTRCVESIFVDPLTTLFGDQRHTFHRVTVGWPDEARAWHDTRVPDPPPHIVEKWRRLRGKKPGARH